ALDLVHVRHQAECVGAEQDARDDEPREGGELDTVEHQDDEQGDGEDDRQVFEDVVLAHGGSRYVIASGPVGVGGDAGHTSRVKTIMESRVAGCKVVARISCSITPEHPGGSLDVGTSRFRLLRQDDAVRDAELSRTEAQLRAIARTPRRRCDGARSTSARSSRTGRTSSRSWAITACSATPARQWNACWGTRRGSCSSATRSTTSTRTTFRWWRRRWRARYTTPGSPRPRSSGSGRGTASGGCSRR